MSPFSPRALRAARLRSYIVREHAAGRSLLDILRDPYVVARGDEAFRWSVLEDRRTLEALHRNDTLFSGELERERDPERTERQAESP